MGRRFDSAAAMDDIVSSFPPGHFDQAWPLLRAYVEKLGQHDDLLVQCDQIEVIGDRGLLAQAEAIGARQDLLARASVVFAEALDMAAALGVLPGDGRKQPPPRLN
jgi:hypothetical protein